MLLFVFVFAYLYVCLCLGLGGQLERLFWSAGRGLSAYDAYFSVCLSTGMCTCGPAI